MNKQANGELLLLDSTLDRLIHRPVAKKAAAFLARTSITPNQLTMISLIPALFSAVLFLRRSLSGAVVAFFLFYLWSVLDHTDGELARSTGSSSDFGRQLDDFCDNLGSVLIFSGIFYGFLPFWNDKDQNILEFFFWIGLLLNHISGILLCNAKRSARQKAISNNNVNPDFIRSQKFLDLLSSRDLIYLLLLVVLSAFYFKIFILYSCVIAMLIGGLFATGIIFLVSLKKIS